MSDSGMDQQERQFTHDFAKATQNNPNNHLAVSEELSSSPNNKDIYKFLALIAIGSRRHVTAALAAIANILHKKHNINAKHIETSDIEIMASATRKQMKKNRSPKQD